MGLCGQALVTYSCPINVHAEKKILLRKALKRFDTEVVKKLRKFQRKEKKISYGKKYTSLRSNGVIMNTSQP